MNSFRFKTGRESGLQGDGKQETLLLDLTAPEKKASHQEEGTGLERREELTEERRPESLVQFHGTFFAMTCFWNHGSHDASYVCWSPIGHATPAAGEWAALPRCLRATPLPESAGQGLRRAGSDSRCGQSRVDPSRPPADASQLETGQALDHQPRPTIRRNKKRRDRWIRLAEAHADWVLGFADEVWWSRLAQPDRHAWAEGKPIRLQEMTLPKDDTDPKAVACDGMLRADTQEVLVRFVDGRPVSHVTTAFLNWVWERLAAEAKKALRLVWDHASWHLSQEVRGWIRTHNRQAKRAGGVRIVVCQLPVKSPWLNRIEPHWIHAKRAVVEPGDLLSKAELISRICASFNGKYVEHLQQVVAKKVA